MMATSFSQKRKQAIIDDDRNVRFKVAPNYLLVEYTPWYELCSFNMVNKFDSLIVSAAKEKGIDPDLIRAIMYMETSHGYYDYPLAFFDMQKSILPMNINHDFWGDAFGTREQLKNPAYNIMAGAELLRRLTRLAGGNEASIEQIATLYNNHASEVVNQYGNHVARIYRTKPWKESSCLSPWYEIVNAIEKNYVDFFNNSPKNTESR